MDRQTDEHNDYNSAHLRVVQLKQENALGGLTSRSVYIYFPKIYLFSDLYYVQ